MKAFLRVCMAIAIAVPAAAQSGSSGSLSALSTQPSMNVFRRFAVDRAKMIEFYGEVLGLKQLPSIQLRRRQRDDPVRHRHGAGEAAGDAGREPVSGGDVKATSPGFACLHLLLSRRGGGDGALHGQGLSRRRRSRRAPPAAARPWCSIPRSSGWSWWCVPGAPADTYQRFEVGITASNLEKSRAFYRSFVGLEELPPVVDPVLGTTKYPFRHGDTTINVWSFGGPCRPTRAAPAFST